MTDNPQSYGGGSVGGPSALSRIDRDLLSNPGLTTVYVDEGQEDILNGRSPLDNGSTPGLESGYTALNNELAAFGITAVYLNLTPCDGYTGDGATGNSTNDPCTATVDTNRNTINGFLSNMTSAVDACTAVSNPVVATCETTLDSRASVSDKVNLSIPGYAAIASAIEPPLDSWPLNDGNGLTSVQDTAYLYPFTLSGGTSWPADPARGTVLGLDGTTGYGDAGNPVPNDSQSFSAGAWAMLTSTAGTATIISQDGTTSNGFALGYSSASGKWTFSLPSADATNPAQAVATGTAATTGTWTYLAGTYNAITNTASIYVNGSLAGTAAVSAGRWQATGDLIIGRAKWNGSPGYYWPGDLSGVQVWNYALTGPQITAIYDQIP